MPPLAPTTTAAGAYVRKLRKKLGYSRQEDFAKFLGVTQSTISRVESGDRPLTASLAFKLITKAGADPAQVRRHVTRT